MKKPLSIVVGLTAALLASGCSPSSDDGPGEAPPAVAGSSAVPGERPDPARIQAGHVGSETCRTCHEEAFAAWQGSRHHAVFRQGETPGFVGAGLPPFTESGMTVVTSTVGDEDPKPALQVSAAGAGGTFPVQAVIGGKHMEAYAALFPGGVWQLLPVSYRPGEKSFRSFLQGTCGIENLGFSRATRWDSYERTWNHRCIGCHVTAGDIGFDPQSWSYETTFIEPGVGCEACHGPGEAHVAAAGAGRGAEGLASLKDDGDPGAAMGPCASCHALAFPFGSRWGGDSPYRPGDSYDEAFITLLGRPFPHLVHADHSPAAGVMEYQGLTQSLCFLEGKADCTTCHDPHGAGEGGSALRGPADTLCAGCHRTVAAQGRKHTRHAPGSPGASCVDCHMAPVIDTLGTRLRSHAIDIPLPVNNVDFKVPDACTSCHDDRDAAWAAARYRELWGSPESTRRRKLARGFAGRDPVLLREILADPAELLRADAAAVLRDVAGVDAAADLIRLLEEDPSLQVRRHAADLLGGLGTPAEMPLDEKMQHFDRLEAIGVPDALRRVDAGTPASLRLSAYSALARLGTPDGLEKLESLLDDPELAGGYRLHQVLGKYYLLTQRMEESEREFRRALEITPNYLGVMRDLGFVYYTTERFEQAHEMWSRALRIDPDNAAIQREVHLAEDAMLGRSHSGPLPGEQDSP